MKVYYEPPLFVPVEMQVNAHDLIEVGQLRKAARLLAKQAQLRRTEARPEADVLQAGDVLPDFPGRHRTDLAVRVRELQADGRRKEAVFTVRSKKAMGAAEAEAYVDSLGPGSDPRGPSA